MKALQITITALAVGLMAYVIAYVLLVSTIVQLRPYYCYPSPNQNIPYGDTITVCVRQELKLL